MPTHLYLRLGLWDEALLLNEASNEASNEAIIARHGNITLDRSYHTVEFLQYIYINQGKISSALDQLIALETIIDLDPFFHVTYQFLYSRYFLETLNFGTSKDLSLLFNCTIHDGDYCDQVGNYLWSVQADTAVLLVRGFAAAQLRDVTFINIIIQHLNEYYIKVLQVFPTLAISINAMINQVNAMKNYYLENIPLSLLYAAKAAELENSVNPPAYVSGCYLYLYF